MAASRIKFIFTIYIAFTFAECNIIIIFIIVVLLRAQSTLSTDDYSLLLCAVFDYFVAVDMTFCRQLNYNSCHTVELYNINIYITKYGTDVMRGWCCCIETMATTVDDLFVRAFLSLSLLSLNCKLCWCRQEVSAFLRAEKWCSH